MIAAIGFPLVYHLVFVFLSIALFLIILALLFVNISFDRSVAAFILCFFNIVISAVASQGFFAIDFYGYDANGVLVGNMVSDYDFLGIIFMILVYICVILLVYCLYSFYKKPWDKTAKVEYNPYVNYK